MNHFPEYGAYGSLYLGYHYGKGMVIIHYLDSVRVFELETLKEIAKQQFKMPITRVLLPKRSKKIELQFAVITEDQYSHLLSLQKSGLVVTSSAELNDTALQVYCLLYDKFCHAHVLSEKGVIKSLSKPSQPKIDLSWPPKTMQNIKRFCPCQKFDGQKVIAPNSAAFLAYHYMNDDALISSWIYNFETKEILNGPFSITTAQTSIYLNSRYFMSGPDIYSVNPYKTIGGMAGIVLSSNSDTESVTISNNKGQIYQISQNGLKQIGSIIEPIVRLEATDEDFCYLTFDGKLITNSTKATLNLYPSFDIAYYSSLFAIPGHPNTIFRPLKKKAGPLPISFIFGDDEITNKHGAKWTAPAKISSYDYHQIAGYDYFIASTALTVTIMKAQPNDEAFELVFDTNWEKPVTSVGINQKSYVVADLSGVITLKSLDKNDQTAITIQTSLCMSISMSDFNIACGLADGTFQMISLKNNEVTYKIRPFRHSLKKVFLTNDGSVALVWSDTTIAEVVNYKLQFVALPTLPSGNQITYENGLVAISSMSGVEIYDVADGNILAQIPIQCVSISACKRRIAALSTKNELIILHYHHSIAVQTQVLLRLTDPLSVHITSNAVYIVCRRQLHVFDFEGKPVNTYDFLSYPRCASASENCLFIAFGRFLWIVNKDEKPKKFPHDKTNLKMITAINDNSFALATTSRVIVAYPSESKYTQIAKIERKIVSIKAIKTKEDGPVDKIAGYFADETMEYWEIPQSK
ncbi:hypothetical protein TVAG_405510 [Trichomonas vaginalis G3]|uniref:Uncharacterized protein n=1 Tax=Trichomonas vaginalis (strain ATCC PRA-98 / G3) TaxID=412133 RepID=A2FS61_TRIV3|nr:WD40 repeat-like family [Trichomonas vaginalis G3]EAX92252.1 hypothetical protein TVAG_405510 [Trichomonas vaginalis G3]KAI5502378.1 WD40 repeat-like family [Trichomonas vaginalis G3]|eukprot:XP_001305182.1 hypothetical protein [Trichomonas vaginalis G3]